MEVDEEDLASAPESASEPAASGVETDEMIDEDVAAASVDNEHAALFEEPPPHFSLYNGLVILPPKQQQENGSSASDANGASSSPIEVLVLPMLRSDEPVSSLRFVLSEVVGMAHFTNYRFELEANGPDSSKTTPWTASSIISPYTGRNAVVSIPTSVKALKEGNEGGLNKVALDEWGDLNPLIEQGLCDGSAFRIILQRYDSQSVKDHVVRLRSLLNGNAPSTVKLVEDEVSVLRAIDESKMATNEIERKKGVETSENHFEAINLAAKAHISSNLAVIPDMVTSTRPTASNLADFFYLALGEDPKLYHSKLDFPKSWKKKKSKNGIDAIGDEADEILTIPIEQDLREKIQLLNELEERSRVDYVIQCCSFHPPPPYRRLMGDIAYLVISNALDDSFPSIHVTATPTGFYVNRTETMLGKRPKFDPSPSSEPCFSHSLLDCLLQASSTFRDAWRKALEASQERMRLNQDLSAMGPYYSLFRYAVRGDFGGMKSSDRAGSAMAGFDASTLTPSWLVPYPRHKDYRNPGSSSDSWNRNAFHEADVIRVEEELIQNFGVDVRSGSARDWNEELQLGREMPVSTLIQRIEKAKIIHKTISEYAEAVLIGVKSITEGYILPMNPMEPSRTHVYMHNNIFFSRATDTGPETFKFVKSDQAARKWLNREIQCSSIFHRIEKLGFHTLATILVDYLGNRYCCQSILPGILIGNHGHKVIYGSVETGFPLKWDRGLQNSFEERIGESMMIANRTVLRNPITQERIDEIERIKKTLSQVPEHWRPKLEINKEKSDPKATMFTSMPLEAKGILGSDNRKYLLDFGRLTPRDANWVAVEQGGTGKWESLLKENGKSCNSIPSSLDDDEWVMHIVRPELVSRFIQHRMSMFARDARKESKDDNEVQEQNAFTTEEGRAFISSLKFNLNVFLPDTKSYGEIDDKMAEQQRQDEQITRDIALYLWDEVLPKLTKGKDGQVHQLPYEGRSLVEFLHRSGVNCRYMGRLAILAQLEEEQDSKVDEDLINGRPTILGRQTLPKCWLELLEIEIVARAAKHVLDAYFLDAGAAVVSQPAQMIASFLSALVSESEETAAQTELRLEKRQFNTPNDDDFAALTITGTGGNGDAVLMPIRSRSTVWQDVELEIGRRFRYTLTLFNNGNKAGRARHVPLLRRICQRTGVRLLAKDYAVGGRCLCSNGDSNLFESFPISPLDIYEVVPLMKHWASYNEGFYPCSLSPSPTIPPLQVSLPDARVAIERAHVFTNKGSLNKGLEYAQETLNLYQRVTESASHPGVIDSIELMASIFHEAEDYDAAALHAEKALSLAIQCGGFDTTNVINAYLTLYPIFARLKDYDRLIKNLRAALYLMDLLCGPLHSEAYLCYFKLGNLYEDKEFNGRYLKSALECFLEAKKRNANDRLLSGITSMRISRILAALRDYKEAVSAVKDAHRIFSMFLGKNHKGTIEIEADLINFTKKSIEMKSRPIIGNENLAEEAAKADAIAAELLASMSVEETILSKGKKKKKKGKR